MLEDKLSLEVIAEGIFAIVDVPVDHIEGLPFEKRTLSEFVETLEGFLGYYQVAWDDHGDRVQADRMGHGPDPRGLAELFGEVRIRKKARSPGMRDPENPAPYSLLERGSEEHQVFPLHLVRQGENLFGSDLGTCYLPEAGRRLGGEPGQNPGRRAVIGRNRCYLSVNPGNDPLSVTVFHVYII